MRLKIQITGLVQGVGFRPFISRLADEMGLKGYVLNDTSGVLIEAEGERETLNSFLIRIEREKPDISQIYSLQHKFLEEAGYRAFEIRESDNQGDKRSPVLPDIAVCSQCLQDITMPRNRRFIYPFTNCTNCGPRFTIISSLPYDRSNTSMKDFRMCPDCEREYNLSTNRRYHAQPNACHVCGPWVTLYDRSGNVICEKDDALDKVVALIRKGNIIALKGVGGYHLLCDAENNEAVKTLRERKHREEKPLAVMFPHMESIKKEAFVSRLEERAIDAIEKPIVIVRKRAESSLAESISPHNKTIGIFLPYTPLHHLIMRKLKRPVVATSANITYDPIVKDEKDAFARLATIADYFLAHNRDILRQCDDSVVRVLADRQFPVRRSRGYVPVPVLVPFRFSNPVLALGPHMNNTIAVGIENKVYVSQHIGDIDTTLAAEFYEDTIKDFLKLFGVTPEVVVADLHPGYYSTKYGDKYFPDNLLKVQHHFAHILSCMAENDIPEETEVIGFAFDGTGYGLDKTIWGSEVLVASYRGFRRAYHLRPFRLPGGDRAVKEPCRSAFSLLYDTIGEEAASSDLIPLSKEEKHFFLNMLKKNIHSPVTTGMGRLFDAVASLIGLRHRVSYHAQAAQELEQLALGSEDEDSYPYSVEDGIIDQRPVIEMILNDLDRKTPKEAIARKFHNTIVKIIVFTSELLKKETGIVHVALSGGVFQNSLLLENSLDQLSERGFTPIIHQLVPPNDGGISLGQAVYSRFI